MATTPTPSPPVTAAEAPPLPVLCINLDSATERWARASADLAFRVTHTAMTMVVLSLPRVIPTLPVNDICVLPNKVLGWPK